VVAVKAEGHCGRRATIVGQRSEDLRANQVVGNGEREQGDFFILN
jgi:hypothetical protein